MTRDEYRAAITKAHRGALLGLASTQVVCDRLGPDDPRLADFMLLDRLGHHIADQLETLLIRHGLPATDSAIIDASATAGADLMEDWDMVMERLRPLMPSLVAEYDALAAAAEPQDRPALDFVTRYERLFLKLVNAPDERGERAILTEMAALLPSDA